MPGPPGLASPCLNIYVEERADGAKRSRHFSLGGFGAVKCRTTWARRVVRLIGTARNWLMVEIGAGNPLIHRIAAVFSGPGLGPGSGLQAPHSGLGLGPEEFEARASPSRALARAFRPSRARDITICVLWVDKETSLELLESEVLLRIGLTCNGDSQVAESSTVVRIDEWSVGNFKAEISDPLWPNTADEPVDIYSRSTPSVRIPVAYSWYG
ncbi:hypothetical protein DFH09DRAFT_1273281 [Mycena vulgaris]|nr:hypothetical protein DFH09DRAFT_1273281 [Mycena vulgaris]